MLNTWEKLLRHKQTTFVSSLGNPQPKYKWFKDGMPLNNEVTSGEPYYRILSTRREDAGVYHCVATNDVGSIFSDRLVFAVACKYLNEYHISTSTSWITNRRSNLL